MQVSVFASDVTGCKFVLNYSKTENPARGEKKNGFHSETLIAALMKFESTKILHGFQNYREKNLFAAHLGFNATLAKEYLNDVTLDEGPLCFYVKIRHAV